MQVQIVGANELVEFPDEMDDETIKQVLRARYTPDYLIPRRNLETINSVEAVEPTLRAKASEKISEYLVQSGILKNRYQANRVGENLTTFLEFVPGIGDATAGDDFGRALGQGDYTSAGFASLGMIPIVGKAGRQGSTVIREIEDRLRKKLDSDPLAAINEYNLIPDTNNGKVLNTDIARELSEDYLKDRSLSASVHEPSSAFIKKRYAEMLDEAPKAGEDAAVLFTAGGTGAGKTTGIGGIVDTNQYQIVYDTNMSTLSKAEKKIEQALNAGKDVDIVMVYREPSEAFQNGSLKRAIRQTKEIGTGRTVPIDSHIKAHKGSLETVVELNKIYKDNPRVAIKVIDNSRGKGNQAMIDVEQLEGLKASDYDKVKRDILEMLEGAYERKEITAETFRGFKGQ
jgi:hypothetical protein